MTDLTGTNKERFEKTIRRKEKLANFLYDLAKACFTLMVIAGMGIYYTDGFTLYIVMFILTGLFLTFVFAWIANRIFIY